MSQMCTTEGRATPDEVPQTNSELVVQGENTLCAMRESMLVVPAEVEEGIIDVRYGKYGNMELLDRKTSRQGADAAAMQGPSEHPAKAEELSASVESATEDQRDDVASTVKPERRESDACVSDSALTSDSGYTSDPHKPSTSEPENPARAVVPKTVSFSSPESDAVGSPETIVPDGVLVATPESSACSTTPDVKETPEPAVDAEEDIPLAELAKRLEAQQVQDNTKDTAHSEQDSDSTIPEDQKCLPTVPLRYHHSNVERTKQRQKQLRAAVAEAQEAMAEVLRERLGSEHNVLYRDDYDDLSGPVRYLPMSPRHYPLPPSSVGSVAPWASRVDLSGLTEEEKLAMSTEILGTYHRDRERAGRQGPLVEHVKNPQDEIDRLTQEIVPGAPMPGLFKGARAAPGTSQRMVEDVYDTIPTRASWVESKSRHGGVIGQHYAGGDPRRSLGEMSARVLKQAPDERDRAKGEEMRPTPMYDVYRRYSMQSAPVDRWMSNANLATEHVPEEQYQARQQPQRPIYLPSRAQTVVDVVPMGPPLPRTGYRSTLRPEHLGAEHGGHTKHANGFRPPGNLSYMHMNAEQDPRGMIFPPVRQEPQVTIYQQPRPHRSRADLLQDRVLRATTVERPLFVFNGETYAPVNPASLASSSDLRSRAASEQYVSNRHRGFQRGPTAREERALEQRLIDRRLDDQMMIKQHVFTRNSRDVERQVHRNAHAADRIRQRSLSSVLGGGSIGRSIDHREAEKDNGRCSSMTEALLEYIRAPNETPRRMDTSLMNRHYKEVGLVFQCSS